MDLWNNQINHNELELLCKSLNFHEVVQFWSSIFEKTPPRKLFRPGKILWSNIIVWRRVEGIQYCVSLKYSSNMVSIEALYRKSWKLICNVIIPFPFSNLRSEKRLKDDLKRTPPKKIKVTEELHAIWSEKNTQSFSSFCFYNFKKIMKQVIIYP